MSKRGDNIHKRKDGRWEGRYKMGMCGNGKTKYGSVYGKSYKEAKEKLIAVQSTPNVQAPKAFNKIFYFSEILLIWMENNKLKHKGSTEHKYWFLIENHINPELGAVPISEINSVVINRFLDKKMTSGRLDKKGGLSSSYIKTMSFIIQSAIAFANQKELCSPLNTSICKPISQKKEFKILSKSEQQYLEKFLTSNLDYTRLGVLICLHTGVRLGEVCALTSLSVDQGEICVILGHSGSGKSTMLNMLGGLDTLDGGSITVAGNNISGFSGKQLTEYRRENVGFVFQFYNLIPDLTVAENIKVIADVSKDPMDLNDLLKVLGIEKIASRFPNEISGGQQQRVAIARAMIKKPKVLLCDELTGALDSSSARDVLRLVQKVNKEYGTTILIVTHNEEIKKMADRYIQIRDGKVVVNEVQTQKTSVEEMNL